MTTQSKILAETLEQDVAPGRWGKITLRKHEDNSYTVGWDTEDGHHVFPVATFWTFDAALTRFQQECRGRYLCPKA